MTLSILNLLAVLLVAWLAGIAASKLGYPSVLGELLAGIILGPPLFGLLHGSDPLAILAELGILVMMLYIGMEIDPKELGKASKGGVLAALGGFITPFVLCYLAIIAAGGTAMAAIFVGVAAGVTSLATKSRILVDLHLLDTRIAHVLMAGALIADTLSLIIFAAVIGVAEAGAINLTSILLTIAKAAAFFLLAFLAGTKLVPPIARRVEKLGTTPTFTFVLLIGFLFAEGAELADMHGVLGAFLAGLFLREQVFGRSLSHHLMDLVRHASIGFLAPIFFVTAGFAVTLDVLSTDLGLLLAVIVLATLGKIIGTVLFYLPTGFGWREGVVIGAGMNGRGAVEIIVAQIGLSAGLISQDIFSILVFMAIATTATVPLFLKWGTEYLRRRNELVRAEGEREGVLIVGAGPTARALADVLARSQPVTLVDRNTDHCAAARAQGLKAVEGDALDERVLAAAEASHVRAVVALTPNPEVNALAARLAREVFLVPDVHVVSAGGEEGREAMDEHLDTTVLFGRGVHLDDWDYRLLHDTAELTSVPVSSDVTAEEVEEATGGEQPSLVLAVQRGETYLPYHGRIVLQDDDVLLLLRSSDLPEIRLDRFDRLVREAVVLDFDEPIDADSFFTEVAQELAPRMGIQPLQLASLFADREAASSTVILPGLAVPHVLIEGERQFAILLARCRKGVTFPTQDEPIYAVFVLAGSEDERNLHLRALAAIASVVQSPEFEKAWLTASDEEALRDLVLRSPRRRLEEAAIES